MRMLNYIQTKPSLHLQQTQVTNKFHTPPVEYNLTQQRTKYKSMYNQNRFRKFHPKHTFDTSLFTVLIFSFPLFKIFNYVHRVNINTWFIFLIIAHVVNL